MGKLIMPKQTGEVSKVVVTLEILKESYDKGNPEVKNQEYKKQIISKISSFSENSDGAMLVKQSEMARYFGLAVGNFAKKSVHISETGIFFLDSFLKKKNSDIIDIISESIINHSFGRNNTAIKSSDSDLDPPKLLVKAILSLNGITRNEFSLLIYLTNDLLLDFDSAILEITAIRQGLKSITIPTENINKYSDIKILVFLEDINFIFKNNDGHYLLSKLPNEKYYSSFLNLSIYNSEPNIKSSILHSKFLNIDDDGEESKIRNKVQQTLPYDTESKEFEAQNNRIPEQVDSSSTSKYVRNARIAKTALFLCNHSCQVNNNHSTFINKYNVPFMEPHHLIPVSAQKDISVNLDRVENIVALCPNCHSAIHYGNDEIRRELLEGLYALRHDELEKVGIIISFDDLFFQYYS